VKKRFKIWLTVLMIPVLLLSTSGFTLIHHHCSDCGLKELHFSMFEKDQDFKCDHFHNHFEQETCSGNCNGICDIVSTEENKGKTTCCSNEFEFHKLAVPLVFGQNYDIDISPVSIDLLYLGLDVFSNFSKLFESDFIVSDSSPPERYYNQSINILLCTFTC
jgi:hypothetical protein